jgi:hypothetical protein
MCSHRAFPVLTHCGLSIDLDQQEHAALCFERKMIAELAAISSECNRVG